MAIDASGAGAAHVHKSDRHFHQSDYLSESRDQEAAEALFRSAVTVTGTTPDKVTTDKRASYPPALEEVFCDDVEHRTSKYLNNHLEQDGVPSPNPRNFWNH